MALLVWRLNITSFSSTMLLKSLEKNAHASAMHPPYGLLLKLLKTRRRLQCVDYDSFVGQFTVSLHLFLIQIIFEEVTVRGKLLA